MRTLLERAPREGERTAPAGERLLRGTLHKTCNSLCGIKGYASLIARTAPEDADQAAWAAKIIREVERMEAIFRSVGDLTRPGARDARTAGLDEVAAAAAAAASERHPHLAVACGTLPDRPALLPAADLGLVLRELLDNCAEGRDGRDGARHVRIEAGTGPEGRPLLLVADDGPGLAPQVRDHAADPFVTTKADRPGVGLTRVDTLLDLYGLAWHLADAPGGGTLVTCEVGGPAAGFRGDGTQRKAE